MPKPVKVEFPGCILYNGDCAEILPMLAPVELFVTDPPYGINYVTNHRKVVTEVARPIEGDDHIPIEVLAPMIGRLTESGAIYWFCTENGIAAFNGWTAELGLKPKRALVWDKGNWAAGDLEGDWGVQVEYVAWAAKPGHKLRGTRPSNLIRGINRVQSSEHPTEKPVPLMERLILVSSDPYQVVCDPFAGIGATVLAAIKCNRYAIGIEIDKTYFDVMCKRVEQALSIRQLRMFEGA